MFWCAYHTWIWPFLFASRSCSFLFPKWITGNSLRKCVCVCVSSHLEDQVLISWFLAISKLAFTGTFTGSPLFLMGVKTWFTIKFSKQINSAIVFFFCTWLVIELSGFWVSGSFTRINPAFQLGSAWRKRDIVAQIWGKSSLHCHWAKLAG